MIRTVIIAYDYSEEAHGAATYIAEALQDTHDAKLVLYNLFSLPTHAAHSRITSDAFEEFQLKNRIRLQEAATAIQQKFGVQTEAVSTFGSMLEEMERLIKEVHADLVVMGMAPKTIEKDLLGNTTTTMISKLDFPVLAIPLGAKYEQGGRILYACDTSYGVHRQVLENVRRIALTFGSEVEIFSVSERLPAIGEEASYPFESTFGEGLDGISYHYRNVQSNAIIREIQNEVNRTDAKILIMAPMRHGFWGSLVHKSKTRIMATGLHIPLLSIPLDIRKKS